VAYDYRYQPFFNKFLEQVLPLDPSRVDRINGAWQRLIDVIGSDEAFRRYRPQIVAQGSYAAGTAVRPTRPGDEFDVDLVVKLTLPVSWSSTETLTWIRSRLALDGVFKTRIQPHPRCVRISYASDFHMDVVPARRVATTMPISGVRITRLKVPDRVGGWRFSNPEGFVRWCEAQDKRTGGDFGRVVMLMKRWRDYNEPDHRRVKSIVFTTLLGRSVPGWTAAGSSSRPDADVLIATLRSLSVKLAPITGVPYVRNPSMASENLARSWKRDDFVVFRKELKDAFRLALEIRKSKDPSAWSRLFGPTFPSTP
jgi:hypothetical protein